MNLAPGGLKIAAQNFHEGRWRAVARSDVAVFRRKFDRHVFDSGGRIAW